MAVYGFDDGRNKQEVYTSEQVLSILQQAIEAQSLQGIDPNESPIVALIKENNHNNNLSFWSGTEAEYNALQVDGSVLGARVDANGNIYLLTDDTTLEDFLEEAAKVVVEIATPVTLTAAGWSNTAPYTQTVAVSNVIASKDYEAPFILPTGVQATDEANEAALACISGGETGDGVVTLYCYDEKPTIDFTVYLKSYGRYGGGGSTEDCVHKTGNETINGIKTFEDSIEASSIGVYANNNVKRVVLSPYGLSFYYQGQAERGYLSFPNIASEQEGMIEDASNKVTSLSAASTDAQYPSAKCVYDLIGDIESLLGGI